MNVRCLLLGHKKRELPWFKSRDYSTQWTNPKEICMRCFKTWRKHYILHVSSAEGAGFGWYMGQQWEGQNPPEGYASWDEYRERMAQARRDIFRKMR